MNAIGYFEIQVNEPERAIKFYTNIFDWKFVKEDTFPIDYWRIENAGTNGGLLERPARTLLPARFKLPILMRWKN